MDQPIVAIKLLSKTFSGSKHFALKDVNLTVNPGDICGIIGMSGAGKSTLLRCLTGLEAPTSGAILIEGQDITRMSSRELSKYRSKIGMVFQHFNLFSSRTAAENIAYPMEIHGIPKEEQEKRLVELLELVGLSHKRDVYPARLSGGEKQRIGIARALAINPHLLLCDEPTSALDPKTSRSILQLLQKLNQELGLTIIIITHQIEAVKQICTKLAVLSHGQIVEQGEITELFIHPRHQTTSSLLHGEIGHIPEQILKNRDPAKLLVRLCFESGSAQEPLIAKMSKLYNVETNILLGNLDCIHDKVIGNLIVELAGTAQERQQALLFLNCHKVNCEVIP